MAASEAQAGTNGFPIDWTTELEKHGRWLRTVVALRTGEIQAVDEVMQEVALAAVRQHSPVVKRESVAPWLYRLAVRQALMYRRQKGRQRKLERKIVDRTATSQTQDKQTNPLGWLLAEERRQMVRTALTRLPSRDGEILLLKYTENWSYHQLAEHIGISQSAVESRLHRARQRLREELAAMDVIENTQ